MKELFLGPAIAFVMFLVATRVLEWLKPASKRLPIVRRGFATDVAYWVFTPLVTKAVTRVALIAALIPVALLIYGQLDKAQLLDGFGPLSRLPLWAQAVAMLVIADFIGYWMHRVFHRGRLWKFHAVHHSIEELDWLAAHRVHPVDQIITKSASLVPIFAFGFSAAPIAVYFLIYHWQSLLLHSNVAIPFGPLRWLVASPQFHHWHHANHVEAFDKNFAGQLSVLDWLFGTMHMPGKALPTRYGTDDPVPDGYVQQLAYPFTTPAPVASGASAEQPSAEPGKAVQLA